MPSQQLYATNISVNVGEALEARIKDPLWFLARQWQTGEFEAENGGSLAAAFITSREYPLAKVTRGNSSQPVSLDAPLDALVEAEAASGDSPAWNSEALAYSFGVETAAHKLQATDYFGKGLDWFHFDVAAVSTPASPPATTERRIVPTALQFRGMPYPRWWRFEDGDADFERPDDPEPNILATLLPEFVVIDSNNWYLVPLKQTAGTVREIVAVKVVDGFGIVTEIAPSDRSTWRMFAMSGQSAAANNGALLFVPNIALDVLDNDALEEIVVLRDEDANLVWAVERQYPGPDGEAVLNGDRADTQPSAAPGGDARPRFRFRADVPRHWIPYVPRKIDAVGGDTYLRRGRTDEAATREHPQYHTRVVGESWRLREEEIPRSGLRVRRLKRFARGSDGTGFPWTARSRETAPRLAQPGLRFDFLEERT
ncbi:MAG TPA: hypothetical protein VHI98_03140 [Vicinamibacterales bacterium]|jgi:hypothetical protein|nr:hypothetical protein [Vicinamibacterales bacterium]